MRDYRVMVKRTFAFETSTEAPTAQTASQQVIDDWGVPNGSGENMFEELGTMRRALNEGTISPLTIGIEVIDVI